MDDCISEIKKSCENLNKERRPFEDRLTVKATDILLNENILFLLSHIDKLERALEVAKKEVRSWSRKEAMESKIKEIMKND